MLNNKKTIILKVITKIVLLTFIVFSLNDFSYLYATPITTPLNQNINVSLNIPLNFGQIIEIFQGKSQNKIILIENSHCDPIVQKNIYQIIANLKQKYGNNFQMVAVEGAPKMKIKTKILANIPNKILKEKIVVNC